MKLFQRKDKREIGGTPGKGKGEEISNKTLQTTPRMKFGAFLRAPSTPTLNDASLKGEQKRSAVLHTQLQDLSLTASKAYDEIEDLKLKNKMLNDQVHHQKDIIGKLMNQLDDLANEKKKMKELHDEDMKQKLELRRQAEEKIDQHRKELLAEIDRLKRRSFNKSSIGENDDVQSYKKEISQLKQQIVELQNFQKEKASEYEESLLILKNSIKLMKNNSSFLNQHGYLNSDSAYPSSTKDDCDGTFLISGA